MLTRFAFFILGLCSLSFGIALITNAHLGTSSVSACAYVLSMGTGLSMGFYVFMTNFFFFIVQIALDAKGILIKAVRQLPVCALFGFLVDLAMPLAANFTPESGNWFAAAAMVVAGSIFVGAGVASMVFARLLILPPEGAVLAVMQRWGGSFGTLRTGVDVIIVAVGLAASFWFWGEVRGIREGTLIAVLLSGQIAKRFLIIWGRLFPKHRVIDG